MTKKRIRDLDALDMLSTGSADTSLQAIDAELFGTIQQNDANRQSASPVSIYEIAPDPSQPRRAVPHLVREKANWHGEVNRIRDLFEVWESLVNEERGVPTFNLRAYVDQEEIGRDDHADRPDEIGALEFALVSLVELATSIRADGLTNPITVVRRGVSAYQLETGERRWLAYHLLHIHTNDDTFSKIAARVVDTLNIWRQASENNARANLNAISKARQFSMLLMDLIQENEGITFTPFHEFAHEQGYYAQVADGEMYRIPRGTSERLLNATGLKSQKQLREYRALLRLPKSVWVMADDLNWPERAIRDLQMHSMNDDDLVVLAARKAHEQGYTVPMGTLSQKQVKAITKPKTNFNDDPLPPAPGDKQYFSYFVKLMNRARTGKPELRDEALNMIDEFRRWLDEEENKLLR